jgi:hypothetical protein
MTGIKAANIGFAHDFSAACPVVIPGRPPGW